MSGSYGRKWAAQCPTQKHFCMTTPPNRIQWFELPHAPAVGAQLTTLDELPDGQATLVALDTGADQPFRLLLTRTGLEVKAFVNRCAHFGVPLAAKQAQLIFKPNLSVSCNVHYARYRWSDGVCEFGDCAGESLIALPLDIAPNGLVCIAQTGGPMAAPSLAT
jgi:nitrite reductase/ring-hydroxylating ferredoxin subunit